MEDDRIETTRNRVFVRELAFGKDSPIAMKTNDNFVYSNRYGSSRRYYN